MYSLSKAQEGQRSLDDIYEEIAAFRKIIGDRRLCIIMEPNSRGQKVPRELRDAIAKELNSVIKALAIISPSPLSRMVANLFFGFKAPNYPMKLFSNLQDAERWIRKYL